MTSDFQSRYGNTCLPEPVQCTLIQVSPRSTRVLCSFLVWRRRSRCVGIGVRILSRW